MNFATEKWLLYCCFILQYSYLNSVVVVLNMSQTVKYIGVFGEIVQTLIFAALQHHCVTLQTGTGLNASTYFA